jgi:hypothetical protein
MVNKKTFTRSNSIYAIYLAIIMIFSMGYITFELFRIGKNIFNYAWPHNTTEHNLYANDCELDYTKKKIDNSKTANIEREKLKLNKIRNYAKIEIYRALWDLLIVSIIFFIHSFLYAKLQKKSQNE